MTAAKKAAARLRMEINFVGPASALSDPKPASFLFLLGHDTNGRSSKAIFHGAHAQRLRDDIVKALDGSDLKTRRTSIEVSGEWGFAKEPRQKAGEVVKDATGKPIHDRQFEAQAFATILSGPPLEVFRAQRAAMRLLKSSAASNAEVAAAEAAGDLQTALAKSKNALTELTNFLETLAKRGSPTAAPADEYQAAIAAATDGAVNEPLAEAPDAPEPEAARPIPETAETAPAVKPPAPVKTASPVTLAGMGRPRPVSQIAAAAAASGTETNSDPAGDAGTVEQAPSESSATTLQPEADPEAAAQARFSRAGKDFVDADATSVVPAETIVAEIPIKEALPDAPPMPVERPVPQPTPAPLRRGFPVSGPRR